MACDDCSHEVMTQQTGRAALAPMPGIERANLQAEGELHGVQRIALLGVFEL